MNCYEGEMCDIKGYFSRIDYMAEEFEQSIMVSGLQDIEDQEALLDLIAFWFIKGLEDH